MRGDQKGRLNTVNMLGVCEDMCMNVYTVDVRLKLLKLNKNNVGKKICWVCLYCYESI